MIICDDGASAQHLAQKLKVDPAALYRVMRVLAGLRVLRQDDNDRFYVTPFGATLRKDSPQSVRDYAIYSHEFVYDAFRGITDSVRTGKPVIDDVFGFLWANPEQEAIFHLGMSNRGRIEAAAFLKAYKFSEPQTVVDVGGGNGGFCLQFWRATITCRVCYSIRHRPLKRQKQVAVDLCPAGAGKFL